MTPSTWLFLKLPPEVWLPCRAKNGLQVSFHIFREKSICFLNKFSYCTGGSLFRITAQQNPSGISFKSIPLHTGLCRKRENKKVVLQRAASLWPWWLNCSPCQHGQTETALSGVSFQQVKPVELHQASCSFRKAFRPVIKLEKAIAVT